MMRSLFSGVSGLKNHQTRMDVIGNNISNVNTTGFKSSRVNFTDMLAQNLSGASAPNDNIGGTNPKQVGLGSAVGAVDLLFTNGSVQSTGVNTDLALSSTNALFILDTGSGTAYTRNGDFQFDADGNYVQAGNGYYVQGWMADKSGALNTNSKVTNITIPSGKSMDPVASAAATYTNNLNAEVPTIVKIAGGTEQTPSATPREYTKSTDGTMTADSTYPVTITVGTTALANTEKEGTYKVGNSYAIGPGHTTTTGTLVASDADPVTITAGGSTFKVMSGSYNVNTGSNDSYKIGTGCLTDTGSMSGSVKVTIGGYECLTPQSGSFSVGQQNFTYPLSNGQTVDYSTNYTVEISTDNGDTWTTLTSGSATASDTKLVKVTGTITNLESDITQLSQPITDLKQNYLESAKATADDSVTLTLSDGSTITQTSGKYAIGESLPVVTTLSVYDTLGSLHELTLYFTLTSAKEDAWRVSLTNDGGNSISWKEADGSITTASMTPVPLKFDTNGIFAGGAGKTELVLSNGSTTPQTIAIDFSKLTQYSSSSTIAGKADGNAAGILSSIAIDKSGVITGTYTNGEKRTEAQVALQRFTNPGGLNKIGESLYEESNNSGKSGEPGTAAALGATITPSALEMSNVDVANEFTDMIVTQRGFQSNSKIITVSDEMLETVVNMKR